MPDALGLGGLLLAAAVSSLTPDQLVAQLNHAWTQTGLPPFASARSSDGHLACSTSALCLAEDGGVLTLTGDVSSQAASSAYLTAQAVLVALTSPGAPVRPAITADRLAVTDGKPADAQLGPVCMRVAPDGDRRVLSTTFKRGSC